MQTMPAKSLATSLKRKRRAFSIVHKPEAQAKPIVPPSAAPSRPVNSGLGVLVLIATFLYSVVW
jgi:hypothetical protein